MSNLFGEIIELDTNGQPIQPDIVLAYRSGRRIGVIQNIESLIDSVHMVDPVEVTFDVHKNVDGAECSLWDGIKDFRLINIPSMNKKDFNPWYEIYVTVDEYDETIKHVSGTHVQEAELSQLSLNNIEINTESDIARDDYVVTKIYDADNPEGSLLNRILRDKASHYSIEHVDSSIANLQRKFSWDGSTILDALNDIAEEVECLFVYGWSDADDNRIHRTISAYDLNDVCMDCGERGTFTDGVCTKCGSTNIKSGYGENTGIFLSKENFSSNISYSTNTDEVKNCFRIEAGDDVMTAAIRNITPSGNQYIWYLSDELRADMSPELQAALSKYDAKYKEYETTKQMGVIQGYVVAYNNLVSKYSVYDPTLEPVSYPIIGYPALTDFYYNAINLRSLLQTSLAPASSIGTPTTAAKEAAKLTSATLSPIGMPNVSTLSLATVDSAVINYAKVYFESGLYNIKVKSSSYTNKKWTGVLTLTGYADSEDAADTGTLNITLTDDTTTYMQCLIEKAMKRNGQDATDTVTLFKMDDDSFASMLSHYSVDNLSMLSSIDRSCLDAMIEQGAATNGSAVYADTYTTLYMPYYNKSILIEEELVEREGEVATIDEILNDIDQLRVDIANVLDLQTFLGDELWPEFCSFRRDDEYKNDNYISDGLTDSEIIENARDLVSRATRDLVKSATLQHTISCDLNNLLLYKEDSLAIDGDQRVVVDGTSYVIDKSTVLSPLLSRFKVGNWLRVEIDGEIYKLRMTDYEIDYSNLSVLSVEFSDVTYGLGTISDLKSIIDKSKSMSTSYSMVKRQANNGNEANSVITNMVENGLYLTNKKIVNADNQNMVVDETGLLMRQMSEYSDGYESEQVKIINRGIYYTNDNWKTASAGLGSFIYYNPETGTYENGYGVIANQIIGNIILGSNLGIYNESGSFKATADGVTITTSKDSSSQNAFTVQRDNGDGTATRYIYIDKDGSVKISGNSISITAGDDTYQTIQNVSSSTSRSIMDNAGAYGLGWKVNASTFTNTNNGECYYHGYTTAGAAADIDGWVLWNGVKVIIPKGMKVNPNSTMPFDETLYSVYRMSNQTFHDVCWNNTTSKWEANTYSGGTPSARSAWTWDEANDIILASYNLAAAESAIYAAQLFTPPKKYSDLPEKVQGTLEKQITDFATTVTEDIEDIYNQLDGVVYTYYYAYKPTTTNYPANEWTTDALKQEHSGDMFLDTSTGVSYRWLKESNTWQWVEIPDEAASQALQLASEAKDTADHKRRVFIATPYVPYDTGDIWMQGTAGDIMVCTNAKASTGKYAVTDWVKLNKYTDEATALAIAEEQVSSIEIGGRNLLYDTNAPTLEPVTREGIRYFSSNGSMENATGTEWTALLDSPVDGVQYGAKCACTATGGSIHLVSFYTGINGLTTTAGHIEFKKGQVYTASFWAKSDKVGAIVSCEITTKANVTPDFGTTYQTIDTANVWKRYTWTFTWTGDDATNQVFYMGFRYNIVATVWLCGFQLEVGNVATDWSDYPQTLISYGGKNLIRNTNTIDLTSNATEPNINGYYNDGTHYGDLVTSSGSTTAVEHGVRAQVTSATCPYIRFGSNNSSATEAAKNGVFGLEKGVDYTISFDYIFSLYSGATNTTNYWFAVYVYYYTGSAWAIMGGAYLRMVSVAERGTTISGHGVYTFNIPEDVENIYFVIRPNNTSASFFAAGDFIELRNMKLEKGNKATDWSAAPEDIAADITDVYVKSGGRNYLVGTSNPVTFSSDTVSTSTTTESFAAYATYLHQELSELGFAVGDKITISFDWEVSDVMNNNYGYFAPHGYGATSSSNYAFIANILNNNRVTPSATKLSGHEEATITLTASLLRLYYVHVACVNMQATVKISNMKLEKGDTASSWLVAPEDAGIAAPGINMIRGTNSMSALANGAWPKGEWRSTSSGSGTRTIIDINDTALPKISKGFRITASAFNNSVAAGAGIGQNSVPNIKPGKSYVVSCYAKGTGYLLGTFGITSWMQQRAYLNNVTEWIRYQFRFSVPNITNYVSTANKTNVFFVVTGAGADIQICGMKLEEGITATEWTQAPEDIEDEITALDESLNQEEVFNRLTGGGKNEGIYLEDGHVYVNASYIKTGTLSADFIKSGTLSADRISGGVLNIGGDDNTDGYIKITDNSGNELLQINNQGIFFEKVDDDGWTTFINLTKRGIYYRYQGAYNAISWENVVNICNLAGLYHVTSTIADIITVNSTNATILSADMAMIGRIVQIDIRWTNRSAISVPASGNIDNIVIGTLRFPPKIATGAWSNGDTAGAAWYTIDSYGRLILGACEGTGSSRTIAAGTEFRALATYAN